ncbi:MAG: response regulator transcription factor, partial [Dehalococcoidales bacterium]
MKESPTIRVLIVDDHHVVREGLRRILELEKGLQVVGEAKSGEEAITKAVSLSPDVIIMDLKMPGMDGIAATREIKQQLPKVNVLVLTLYAEDFVKQAIEAGVSGYLLKDSDCEQITKAIHQVYDGLSPIAPSL